MIRRSHIAVLLIPLALAGCDTFFGVHTVVTDAVTGTPVTGATVKLVLDKGVEEPDVVTTTDTNGAVRILINEHTSAWATMTVSKPGYQTWSTQFKGSPRPGFVIKLKPEKNGKTEPASGHVPSKAAADGAL